MTAYYGTQEVPVPNPPIMIETGPDGSIMLTLRLGRYDDPNDVVVVLGAPEALAFGGLYANAAAHAAADALREAAAGRCSTCSNHRLVDEEQHGRTVAVECPSCRGKAGPWVLWRARFADAVPEMRATAAATRGETPRRPE